MYYKGPFYVEYDESCEMWCVFNELDDSEFAYSTWGSKEGAEEDAKTRNESGRYD
jgi:hypothetical protein